MLDWMPTPVRHQLLSPSGERCPGHPRPRDTVTAVRDATGGAMTVVVDESATAASANAPPTVAAADLQPPFGHEAGGHLPAHAMPRPSGTQHEELVELGAHHATAIVAEACAGRGGGEDFTASTPAAPPSRDTAGDAVEAAEEF